MNKYEKAYAKSYHRHGKYSIEYVRKLWENSKKVYESTGEWPIIDVGNGVCVTMDSDRYSNFFYQWNGLCILWTKRRILLVRNIQR